MISFLQKFLRKDPPLVIVAAISRIDRAIGKNNELLWHIPDDLKRFKKLTNGHPIIMGRKTFDSILEILGKPLPGRTNIVLTRDKTYKPDGATVAHTVTDALDIAYSENPIEVHIGGGAELYRQLLPKVSRLHVTWIDDKKSADTFFPPFEDSFLAIEEHEPREYDSIRYQWIDYRRKKK